MLASSTPYFATMDGDLQHDEALLPHGVQPLNTADRPAPRGALLWTLASSLALVTAHGVHAAAPFDLHTGASLELHGSAVHAPYPPSRLIRRIHWDFSSAKSLRKANGSDIWPCTWAFDDALYCAWGDGGGFDGNSDSVGRVSLGFARVTGTPRPGDPSSYHGKNVWGALPYAEARATFGGKVGSLVAVDGWLYAAGSLWTRQNSKDPVNTWEAGTLDRLMWSFDLGKTWQIARWAPSDDPGIFLQFGHDRANAPGGYVYAYYSRPHDPSHVYLKRIRVSELREAPARELRLKPQRPPARQYLAFMSRSGAAVSWSQREIDAIPVFTDRQNAIGAVGVYDAGLARYLLTVGHDPSGRLKDAAPGKLGLFEAPHPWGPWRTIDYDDDWGHFPASTRGDYLGLTFPAKWISQDGRTLWGVYSGPDGLDAFNLVQARLVTSRGRQVAHGAPELTRCREHYNVVNGSVFMNCHDAHD